MPKPAVYGKTKSRNTAQPAPARTKAAVTRGSDGSVTIKLSSQGPRGGKVGATAAAPKRLGRKPSSGGKAGGGSRSTRHGR